MPALAWSMFSRKPILSLLTILFALPAPAIVVVGDASRNKSAKAFGAGSGESICAIEFLHERDWKMGTGTLIRVDEAARTGYVLTCAHGIHNGKRRIQSITLTFEANALRHLDRIVAQGYVCHPDYRPEGKVGPDLALIAFPLPSGFRVKPMLLPGELDVTRMERPSHRFIGGYGVFALNGTAGPHHDWSTEDGRVRRVAVSRAGYVPLGKAIAARNSFESTVDLSAPEEVSRIAKGFAYNFKISDDPFGVPPYQTEGAFAEGDSGGPLFQYDGSVNRFRLLGVFGSIAVRASKSDGAGGGTGVVLEAVSCSTALTPELQPWLQETHAGSMHALVTGPEVRRLSRKVLAQAFELDLKDEDLAGEP